MQGGPHEDGGVAHDVTSTEFEELEAADAEKDLPGPRTRWVPVMWQVLFLSLRFAQSGQEQDI